LEYVTPQVILELGTHAEFVPHDRFTIRSFVAEEFPNLVADGDVAVMALLAKRTLWEKATILRAQYHRPPDSAIPRRYSRHYYDVAMLAEGPIRAEALRDMDLLAQVVRHKETFYPVGPLQRGTSRNLSAGASGGTHCGAGKRLPEYGRDDFWRAARLRRHHDGFGEA
jgi:hypothetical protein